MSRSMLLFLLLTNGLVIGLCLYFYGSSGTVLWKNDHLLPAVTFPRGTGFRAIGMLPFVFSFGYLAYQLSQAPHPAEPVSTLDELSDQ